jgi:hypothetical protein
MNGITLMNSPDDLVDDLRSEFLKLWKINRIGFTYFGDIAEQFDGFMYLHMAEFVIYRYISKDKAFSLLLNESSSSSTGGLILKYYLSYTCRYFMGSSRPHK